MHPVFVNLKPRVASKLLCANGCFSHSYAALSRHSLKKTPPLALTHLTVIDCTGAPAQPNSTVVVAQGHITAVGPSDTIKIPAGTSVVDATGKFLIPGLWDMHGHLTDATEDAFPLLITNGVTGVRDMGGDLAQLDRWRSEIDSGLRVGPHMIRAGPFADGPKEGVTNRLTVRTPEEARRAVSGEVVFEIVFRPCHDVSSSLNRDYRFAQHAGSSA